MQYIGLLFLIFVAFVGIAYLVTAALTIGVIFLAASLLAVVKSRHPLVYFDSVLLSVVFCFVWGVCITVWIAGASLLINDFIFGDEFFEGPVVPAAKNFYYDVFKALPEISLALILTYLSRKFSESSAINVALQPLAILGVFILVEGVLRRDVLCGYGIAIDSAPCAATPVWMSIKVAAKELTDPIFFYVEHATSDPLLIFYFADRVTEAKGNLFEAIPLLSVISVLVIIYRTARLIFGKRKPSSSAVNNWDWSIFYAFALSSAGFAFCVRYLMFLSNRDFSGRANFFDAMLGLSAIPTLVGLFVLPLLATVFLATLTLEKSESNTRFLNWLN